VISAHILTTKFLLLEKKDMVAESVRVAMSLMAGAQSSATVFLFAAVFRCAIVCLIQKVLGALYLGRKHQSMKITTHLHLVREV
jgi:hypothetical protein